MQSRSRERVTRRTPQRAEARRGAEVVAELLAEYQAGQPSTALMRTYKAQEVNWLYSRGWPLARIGDYFGKDHNVVRNALVREGIALRARRR
jgi:hypothetical protein